MIQEWTKKDITPPAFAGIFKHGMKEEAKGDDKNHMDKNDEGNWVCRLAAYRECLLREEKNGKRYGNKNKEGKKKNEVQDHN